MSSQQTPTTTHSVETPSGRISYASAGSGPVALFVHGVVLNKHLWRHQLTGLSDTDDEPTTQGPAIWCVAELAEELGFTVTEAR